MWLYESNYRRLRMLMPELFDGADEFRVAARHNHQLTVRVLEQFPYTSTFDIVHRLGSLGRLPELRMRVRLYHDARVAEVVAYQDQRRIQPEYEFPNERMLHKDEKRQANRLLHDLLRYIELCGQDRSRQVVTSEA
jgi:uncharacterized protein YqiB (DUF1249 family)